MGEYFLSVVDTKTCQPALKTREHNFNIVYGDKNVSGRNCRSSFWPATGHNCPDNVWMSDVKSSNVKLTSHWNVLRLQSIRSAWLPVYSFADFSAYVLFPLCL